MPDPTGSLPPLANAACCYNYTWGANTGAHDTTDPSKPGVRVYQDCLANCGNYACCLGPGTGGSSNSGNNTGTGSDGGILGGVQQGITSTLMAPIISVENWLFNVFKIGMANFIGIMVLIFAVWLLFRETKTKEFVGRAARKTAHVAGKVAKAGAAAA